MGAGPNILYWLSHLIFRADRKVEIHIAILEMITLRLRAVKSLPKFIY